MHRLKWRVLYELWAGGLGVRRLHTKPDRTFSSECIIKLDDRQYNSVGMVRGACITIGLIPGPLRTRIEQFTRPSVDITGLEHNLVTDQTTACSLDPRLPWENIVNYRHPLTTRSLHR